MARTVSGPAIDPIPAGTPAPEFAWSENGAPARLQERCAGRGAFVLFLPLAGAPVCREDVRGLARAALELGAPQRPMVVVSVDVESHLRRFLDELGADRLAHRGDPDLSLARAFGVACPGGFAARASFLVGRDGRVAAASVDPIAFPRPVAALRSWLEDPSMR
jgi:peroxiredoxin